MAQLAQLKHVGIYVQDLPLVCSFYCDVFGMLVTDSGISPTLNKPIVFLSSNAKAHHQLVLIEGRNVRSQPSTVNQLSFQVESFAELRSIYDRLVDYGIAAVRPVDHGNAWSLYTQDPEGNGVEVYADTPWHVAQPHARPIDMKLPDAVIMEATKRAVLVDPTYMPHLDWSRDLENRLAQQLRERG